MAVMMRLRIDELLAERGMRRSELARRTEISEERLGQLARGSWHQVRRKELELIAGALRVSPAELIESIPLDVFASGLVGGTITVHLATGSHPSPSAPADTWERNYVSLWDHRAAQVLIEHAAGLRIPARIQHHEPDRAGGPANQSVEELFEPADGPETHFILGSPMISDLAERVTAVAYGVAPFDTTRRDVFPFNLVWHSEQRSAFGVACGPDGQTGIVSTRTSQWVVRRIDPPSGEGRDGGVIVVYRITLPLNRWRRGVRTERFFVVLCGHSGPGTFACAKVLTDAQHADAFYPPAANVPLMRAVNAVYWRGKARHRTGVDNRVLQKAWPVPEPASTFLPVPGRPSGSRPLARPGSPV